MREFKIIIILFFVVIATSCAQQKKYISYTVKKGETLKIIAKRIGIKTKELMRLNPDTGRKPAPETLIIIPNNGYKSPTVNNILDKLNDLDIYETKKILNSNNENYLLMLCSRNSEIDDNTLETVKNKIFNTRINKIGNAYIQELKGEAFINIK